MSRIRWVRPMQHGETAGWAGVPVTAVIMRGLCSALRLTVLVIGYLADTPPQSGSDHADLSRVDRRVAALAPLLDRPCLVVGKSTVGVVPTPPLSTRSAERRGTEGRGHSGSR
jgi:hypothetical protein